MTFQEAVAKKAELNAINDALSNALQGFEKESNGMISQTVRDTPEFIEADTDFKKSFSELRAFNTWYLKAFKKEIQLARKNRFKK